MKLLSSSLKLVALLLLTSNLYAQAPVQVQPTQPVQVQPAVQVQPVQVQPVQVQPAVQVQPVQVQPAVQVQPIAPSFVSPTVTPNTIAIVADKELTKAQLDELVSAELKNIEREANQRKFEAYQQAIDRFVTEGALEAKRKTTQFASIQEMVQDVVKDITPPSDAEVLAFFEQNKSRIGERSLDEIKPQIKEYLSQQAQQKKLETYLESVKAEFKAQDFLELPRIQIAADGFSKGPADAPITIIEFADYECGFCSKVTPTIKNILDRYPGKIKLVFRDFPLDFHPNATPASIAARCAGKQNKFWEMHELLFANQASLNTETFNKHAQQLGLDMVAFDACSKDPSVAQAVSKDLADGQAVGVTGTPAFFVNGVLLSGALPESEFIKIIDKELKKLGK